MRGITLNQRQARILRDNLTSNQEGYDYLDLCRLDALAKRLTALQGTYAERMAELAREEKQIRRALTRDPGTEAEAARRLQLIAYDVEDINEQAETVTVELLVEDGDWKLINDKLGAVNRWAAADGLRELIIGLVEAVKNATSTEAGEREVVTPFRR